jgi:hypothetical protein
MVKALPGLSQTAFPEPRVPTTAERSLAPRNETGRPICALG